MRQRRRAPPCRRISSRVRHLDMEAERSMPNWGGQCVTGSPPTTFDPTLRVTGREDEREREYAQTASQPHSHLQFRWFMVRRAMDCLRLDAGSPRGDRGGRVRTPAYTRALGPRGADLDRVPHRCRSRAATVAAGRPCHITSRSALLAVAHVQVRACLGGMGAGGVNLPLGECRLGARHAGRAVRPWTGWLDSGRFRQRIARAAFGLRHGSGRRNHEVDSRRTGAPDCCQAQRARKIKSLM